MYVDSSAGVKVKEGESVRVRIDSGVSMGCIMSLWLFNAYMDGVIKECEDGDGKEGSELPRGRESGDC